MSELKDMRVVITGASSGFGSVAAKLLVDHGCKVILGARREDRLKDLVKELGDSSAYEVTDVKKKEDLDRLVQKSIDTFGGVDAIINNAGIMPLSLISAGRTEEWDEMIDVMLRVFCMERMQFINILLIKVTEKLSIYLQLLVNELCQAVQFTLELNMQFGPFLKALELNPLE